MSDETVDLPGHPSHGILSINRVSGSGARFFGTPLACDHFIALEISEGRAYFNRITGTRYIDGAAVVRIRLTPTQWAEAITTLNAGPGVPCTIERRPVGPSERVDDPPAETSEPIRLRDAFVAEVDEKLASLKAIRRRILQQLEAAKISGQRKDEIGREIDAFFKLFVDSAPFMMGAFQEATDASVADAKANVTAFIDHAIREAGLRQLGDGMPTVNLDRLGDGMPAVDRGPALDAPWPADGCVQDRPFPFTDEETQT